MNDTIFALSSAPGRAGVAVVRISGPRALDAWFALTERVNPPPPKKATLALLVSRVDSLPIDQALVLWFPGQGSFTGEPVLEFQIHGGAAVLRKLFADLAGLDGFRMATPGEFTRRAFENGKLDLAQAEAVGLVIDAETEQQRRQALRGLGGDLGRMVVGWRTQLLEIRALIAAEIDFSDEADVGEQPSHSIDSLLQQLASELEIVTESGRKGQIVSEGFNVAIVGAPNSGKSSLLNALAGYEAAIVTEHAGTTRDLIQVKLEIAGYPVILTDTAGLREAQDPVEQIGISRGLHYARHADLVLHLDAEGSWVPLTSELEHDRLIRIRSKSDLPRSETGVGDGLPVSVRVESGLAALLLKLEEELEEFDSAPALITNARQQEALAKASAAIDRCLNMPREAIELRDHEVRAAEAALDALVGRLGVEEVLGAVFSRFCVGK